MDLLGFLIRKLLVCRVFFVKIYFLKKVKVSRLSEGLISDQSHQNLGESNCVTSS